MNPHSPRRILVVDDDDTFRERLASSLRRRGHDVTAAAGRDESLAVLESFRPECAVVDLRLEKESGLCLARELGERIPGIKVLVLTGFGSIATAVDAMRLGAVDYLSKPADADQVLAALFGVNDALHEHAPPGSRVPSLGRVEWEHMQRVLHDCGGNISEAARRLGIERRTLQRKLQKYPPDS